MSDAVSADAIVSTQETNNTPPAPAPAQVQIATPEPKPSAVDAAAEAAAGDEAPATYQYVKTGNTGLDVALEYIGARGIGSEDPAFQAAMKGDFSLLKAKLAGMGTQAQGYQEYVALAETAYAQETEKVNEQAKASTTAALAMFGSGEEAQTNFNQAAAYIKANASAGDVAEINKMLRGGPMQARAAAALMLHAYGKADNITKPMTSAVTPNAAAGSEAPTGKLSAKQFAQEINKLPSNLRNRSDFHNTPEYRALAARL